MTTTPEDQNHIVTVKVTTSPPAPDAFIFIYRNANNEVSARFLTPTAIGDELTGDALTDDSFVIERVVDQSVYMIVYRNKATDDVTPFGLLQQYDADLDAVIPAATYMKQIEASSVVANRTYVQLCDMYQQITAMKPGAHLDIRMPAVTNKLDA